MRKLPRIGKKISSTLTGAVITLAPSLVLAAEASDFINTPTDPGSGNATFSGLVTQVITIILFIVGVAAILYLLFSGLQYVTAGGDDEKAGSARKGIINAVIGIIIVLAVWFIFRATANVGSSIGTDVSNAL